MIGTPKTPWSHPNWKQGGSGTSYCRSLCELLVISWKENSYKKNCKWNIYIHIIRIFLLCFTALGYLKNMLLYMKLFLFSYSDSKPLVWLLQHLCNCIPQLLKSFLYLCCIWCFRLAFRFLCFLPCLLTLKASSHYYTNWFLQIPSPKIFKYQLVWSPSWPSCLEELCKITCNEAMLRLSGSWCIPSLQESLRKPVWTVNFDLCICS